MPKWRNIDMKGIHEYAIVYIYQTGSRNREPLFGAYLPLGVSREKTRCTGTMFASDFIEKASGLHERMR